MKITIDLPDYDGNGMDVIWEDGADYEVYVQKDGAVVFRANTQALMAFGKQMIYMACNDLPIGSHIHYDDFFTGVKDFGVEFILVKKDGLEKML